MRCLFKVALPTVFAVWSTASFSESAGQTASPSAPTAAAEYAQLPMYRDISLSPRGDKAVALRAIGDTYHVVLLDFANGASKLLMAAFLGLLF